MKRTLSLVNSKVRVAWQRVRVLACCPHSAAACTSSASSYASDRTMHGVFPSCERPSMCTIHASAVSIYVVSACPCVCPYMFHCMCLARIYEFHVLVNAPFHMSRQCVMCVMCAAVCHVSPTCQSQVDAVLHNVVAINERTLALADLPKQLQAGLQSIHQRISAISQLVLEVRAVHALVSACMWLQS